MAASTLDPLEQEGLSYEEEEQEVEEEGVKME